MIYTVTFNPSLDYIVSVEDFRLGVTNRTASEQMFPGGKGINVSMVLNNLGMENTALGFLAGFTGEEIGRKVAKAGCHTDFITVPDGISRINMKLKNIDGTEINGMGPDISKACMEELWEKLEGLTKADVLVLAGSIPPSLPRDIYREIMKALKDREILIAVDATKDLLTNVLEYHPFLIKPNNHELGEIFHREFTSRDQVIPYAEKLRSQGARNVLVSMGGKGAVLAAADGRCYEAAAPAGKLVNAVGAGDSMVAGFLTGWMEQKGYEHAFKMGIAAGSASAFSERLATRMEVMEIYKTL